jgi:hypothetical protein
MAPSDHHIAAGEPPPKLTCPAELPMPEIQVPVRTYFALRAAVITACWLPFVVSFLFVLPAFQPIFVRLNAHGMLPFLSACLFSLGEWNDALSGLPLFALIPILVLTDAGASMGLQHKGRQTTAFWCWHVVVAACGVIAELLLLFGSIQPVFKMSALVQ